jgi:hypothetical protein
MKILIKAFSAITLLILVNKSCYVTTSYFDRFSKFCRAGITIPPLKSQHPGYEPEHGVQTLQLPAKLVSSALLRLLGLALKTRDYQFVSKYCELITHGIGQCLYMQTITHS